MPRTRIILLVLIAISVLFLGLLRLFVLGLEGGENTHQQAQSSTAVPAKADSTGVASAPPSGQPAPSDLPMSTQTLPPPPVAAPTPKPQSSPVSNSKYGIHLLLDDPRDHWLPDV